MTASASENIHDQIDQWLDALSSQPAFGEWAEAVRDISPLGPGTHSWLVTFHSGQQTIGYMVVHATEDGGYALGEYGVGEEPLYGAATLRRSLSSLGLEAAHLAGILKVEQHYISPVLAVWRIQQQDEEPIYVDAKTGEQLPIEDADWQMAADAAHIPPSPTPVKLLDVLVLPSFDAFERMPWLTRQPLRPAAPADQLRLREQVRFTADPFEGRHLFVWPVTGYHHWDDHQLYLSVDQEGSRYIPLAVLHAAGSYY
ncbi:hypothetical protein [Paenibacillus sp. 1P07SE]|uniref:hypothetical protein n=1 Tax=Paenibacillus sp. 1P07SE TaxID=3132209 RepID=UPI0039A643D7